MIATSDTAPTSTPTGVDLDVRVLDRMREIARDPRTADRVLAVLDDDSRVVTSALRSTTNTDK